jgi:hypothetical protein
MTRSLALLGLLCLTLTGCPTAQPTAGNDAGRDAASDPVDSGGENDAAVENDAGTTADTGAADTGGTDAGSTDAAAMDDAGPLIDRCSSDADIAALMVDHMGMSIGEHTAACVPGCFTRAAGAARQTCINNCIQGPTRVNGEISAGCTACYALAADCTVVNCTSVCLADSSSPECIACQCDNCSADTVACTGIPDDRCAPPTP